MHLAPTGGTGHSFMPARIPSLRIQRRQSAPDSWNVKTWDVRTWRFAFEWYVSCHLVVFYFAWIPIASISKRSTTSCDIFRGMIWSKAWVIFKGAAKDINFVAIEKSWCWSWFAMKIQDHLVQLFNPKCVDAVHWTHSLHSSSLHRNLQNAQSNSCSGGPICSLHSQATPERHWKCKDVQRYNTMKKRVRSIDVLGVGNFDFNQDMAYFFCLVWDIKIHTARNARNLPSRLRTPLEGSIITFSSMNLLWLSSALFGWLSFVYLHFSRSLLFVCLHLASFSVILSGLPSLFDLVLFATWLLCQALERPSSRLEGGWDAPIKGPFSWYAKLCTFLSQCSMQCLEHLRTWSVWIFSQVVAFQRRSVRISRSAQIFRCQANADAIRSESESSDLWNDPQHAHEAQIEAQRAASHPVAPRVPRSFCWEWVNLCQL